MSYEILSAEVHPATHHHPLRVTWRARFTLSDGSADVQTCRIEASVLPHDRHHSPTAAAMLSDAEPTDRAALRAAMIADIERVEAWLERNIAAPKPLNLMEP